METKDLEEFKAIYERNFGIKLDDASAIYLANSLFRFYKNIYLREAN